LKNIIIDTNSLISFVTDRNPAQQDKIADLFDSAAQLKVRAFIKLPGVEIVHQLSLKTLFAIWPEKVPDYGDAIIASLCKDTKGASVATFDRKFRAKLKKLGISALSF
jgi:predicted nucleic acid-binding protein